MTSFREDDHFVLIIPAAQKVIGAFGWAFDQHALHLSDVALIALCGVL